MFTGIIQEIGTIARRESSNGLVRLAIHAPKTASRVQRMDSVAVNGVCLSVVGVRQETTHVEMIRETQRLTTLSRLRRGDPVNLEPSLLVSDRLGGHLVFGHVDGVGIIRRRRQLKGELVLEIRTSPSLCHRLVPKGPVAVDGISLTVGQAISSTTFSLHLIPETLRQTTVGAKSVGDQVNIELDYFAKLVEQFLRQRPGRR